jgi:hypothetical protein
LSFNQGRAVIERIAKAEQLVEGDWGVFLLVARGLTQEQATSVIDGWVPPDDPQQSKQLL